MIFRQSDPVIGLEHHDPKGYCEKEENPFIQEEKEEPSFLAFTI